MHVRDRPDHDERWLRKYLPEGYWAFRHWGRWGLLKDRPCEPDEIQTSETICTGVKTKWEVLTLARLHHKGRTLPYMYSREYWKDVEHGRPTWWARVCYLIWKLRWLT